MRILVEPSLVRLVESLQARGYQVSVGKDEECPDVYLYSDYSTDSIHCVNTEAHGLNSCCHHFLSMKDFEPNKNGTLLINVNGMGLNAILEAIEHRTYSSIF